MSNYTLNLFGEAPKVNTVTTVNMSREGNYYAIFTPEAEVLAEVGIHLQRDLYKNEICKLPVENANRYFSKMVVKGFSVNKK